MYTRSSQQFIYYKNIFEISRDSVLFVYKLWICDDFIKKYSIVYVNMGQINLYFFLSHFILFILVLFIGFIKVYKLVNIKKKSNVFAPLTNQNYM